MGEENRPFFLGIENLFSFDCGKHFFDTAK
jgi:hypothetical protein